MRGAFTASAAAVMHCRWTSDGTTAGTQLSSAASSVSVTSPQYLSTTSRFVYFGASTSSGYALVKVAQ